MKIWLIYDIVGIPTFKQFIRKQQGCAERYISAYSLFVFTDTKYKKIVKSVKNKYKYLVPLVVSVRKWVNLLLF
jgi:hypothetical protein